MTVSKACSLSASLISERPPLSVHEPEEVNAGDTKVPAHVRYVVGPLSVALLCGRSFLRDDNTALHLCKRNNVCIGRLVRTLGIRKVGISGLYTCRLDLDQRVKRGEQGRMHLCPRP